MGNDECSEMQLIIPESADPSVFVTTLNMSGTSLDLTAANIVVRTLKFWVLNIQCKAFAWVVRLPHICVPHTQL